jgi:hypothetical protein
LATIALCFVVYVCWMGMHIDSLGVYWAGGKAFLDGLDPYAYTAKYDTLSQFKYSPLFALGMAGLAKIQPTMLSIAVWTLLGVAVCVIGLLRWMDASTRFTLVLALALVASFIDLSTCLWANQANALVIGLSLIGLAQYRDNRYFQAGFLLMLATFLKVYPLVFLGPLALRGQRRYWAGAAVGALLAFSAPALFVGWRHDFETHQAWLQLLLRETRSPGMLDLHSALQRAGMLNLAQRLPWVVALVSVPLLLAVRYLPGSQWRPWISMACATVVLLSPKTEVFTFVFLAPAYSLMVMHCTESAVDGLRRYGLASCSALLLVMVASQFVTRNWMLSDAPQQIMRVLAALGFWLLAVITLVQALKPLLEARTAIATQSRSAT